MLDEGGGGWLRVQLYYKGQSQFNGIQNLCVGAVLHNFIDKVEKGEW